MPTPIDLAVAVQTYLKTETTLLGLMGGRVYIDFNYEQTPIYPYLVIEDYEEDFPGETMEDSTISLSLCPVHESRDLVRSLSRTIRRLVDTPGTSETGERTVTFTWADGVETGCTRNGQKVYQLNQKTRTGYVWREVIRYEFDIEFT